MNEFRISLNTVIEADETLLPVERACRVLRRDLRETVSGRGESNVIRVLTDPGIGAEQYRAEVTKKEITLRSNLRWRRGDAVGVGFSEAHKPAAEPAPAAVTDPSLAVLLRRIGELEAENAALRSVLATMGARPETGTPTLA